MPTVARVVGGRGSLISASRLRDVKTVPMRILATEGARITQPGHRELVQLQLLLTRAEPKPHVWAVRTADVRYAKIELVSYTVRTRSGC